MRKNTSRLARGARRVIRRGRYASAGAVSHGVFGGLRRFAFNRNPRAPNTPARVPRRYEFIVYTERPLVHIRKLIVPAVNYSACTAATAAASPHVHHRGTRFHSARVHKCVAEGEEFWPWRKERGGKRTRRAITPPICTRLILICILIAAAIIGGSGFA